MNTRLDKQPAIAHAAVAVPTRKVSCAVSALRLLMVETKAHNELNDTSMLRPQIYAATPNINFSLQVLSRLPQLLSTAAGSRVPGSIGQ